MTKLVDIRLTVNGREYQGQCEPRTLLADFLRDHLDLTGTHVGCEHGVCGACTVLFNGEAARSCLMLAVQAEGAKITTIEGLAQGGQFHPVQKAFHENHALQCGFCTPGMLAATIDFLNTNASPNEEEVREALSAVLCRCTGYQNIVKAVLAAAAEMRAAGNAGAQAHV
ncbi:MAG: (2Fe-2S)-binding protein [Rhizobiales bacterium]|nr:(2Fe-2S)-binding protein [Hyphomicrobiales bacterium]OJY41927.1 MAG: 4-hydroxybenzoyl-CoA reductase subunit gamma [Rhizobiales bacterium 64-17]